ncbi:MAG: type II CRISPR RNA-guided endonuclease Cas9 [Bacteroidales bacterium]
MKRTLGLDLGTNSIGWALVDQDHISAAGSRIIPMDQKMLGDFDKGNSISQTGERTRLRGVRRLYERKIQRRERLHRVLNVLNFLPEHYRSKIDFSKHLGQFFPGEEPNLPYAPDDQGNHHFLFIESYREMISYFHAKYPGISLTNKKIPYDWTIYYLRKKALSAPVTKEELSWLLLHFNQKRGYFQLRGEEAEEGDQKLIEFYELKVVSVEDSGDRKGKGDKLEIWYNVHLENGMIYRRSSRTPLDWVGKTRAFIVTTDLNDDGTPKLTKDGDIKRSFRSPGPDDWLLIKKRSETQLENSGCSVGEYIFDALLENPDLKIKGKFIRTIERKYYRSELTRILETQIRHHSELQDNDFLEKALEELYPNNRIHRDTIRSGGFLRLFVSDIIFYQRPLKSKKSQIENCRFETRIWRDKEGNTQKAPVKGIAKSHPLFEEFRLWQFLSNLKIYKKNVFIDGKYIDNYDVTDQLLPDEQSWEDLFVWLSLRKDITHETFLKYPPFKLRKNQKDYRWNYPEENAKIYPCMKLRSDIFNALFKTEEFSHFPKDEELKIKEILISAVSPDKKKELLQDICLKQKNNLSSSVFGPYLEWLKIEEELWHILYSVDNKEESHKALIRYSRKKGMPAEFAERLCSIPVLKKEYGSYSEKAIKKLLPLMRRGSYKQINCIDPYTTNRLNDIRLRINSIDYNDKLADRVSDSEYSKVLIGTLCRADWQTMSFNLTEACYAVYGYFAENSDAVRWTHPSDISLFLNEFKQNTLRNPVVEQLLTETLRVVKDIWVQHGKGTTDYFEEIHIEMGRDLKQTNEKRKIDSERNLANENTNLRLKALLMELKNDSSVPGVNPNSPFQLDILKLYEDGVLSANEEIPDDIEKISRLSQPSQSELTRYKLWLDQKYQSPYTGELIPLSRLFTREYEIEHIIPQSRFFDDSYTNKVICESDVNTLKGNMLGMEFIETKGGTILPPTSSRPRQVTILKTEEYVALINKNYGGNNNKQKREKLLLTEIPERFAARQMNDSRYIARYTCSLLSNIVRDKEEQDWIVARLIPTNGAVTTHLKQDWGVNEVWSRLMTPRYERLNQITSSDAYGEYTEKNGKRYFLNRVPFNELRGYNPKRIDHRHHAMDAIVIACTTRSHINLLNNANAAGKDGKERIDLRTKLCHKDKQTGSTRWIINSPWYNFAHEVYHTLATITASIKSNTRVINKATNSYLKWAVAPDGTVKKRHFKQVSGDHWAIRKPLHKETVSGKVTLREMKKVRLSEGLKVWESLVDKSLKMQVKELIRLQYTEKALIKFFKDRDYIWDKKDISKVDIYVYNENYAATRTELSEAFTEKKVESITDSGIRTIINRHVNSSKYNGNYAEALSPDGIEELNANIVELNGGKPHKPIYRVRVSEPIGLKYPIGVTGAKKDKWVESAKGTNLFFGIYVDKEGSRSFSTIPLIEVVERIKQGLPPVPPKNEKDDTLLFYLSPGDLVYVPSVEDMQSQSPVSQQELNANPDRIYKLVSFSTVQAFFIPANIASPIVATKELGANNKAEKAWDGVMIKQHCLKLAVTRLGQISLSNDQHKHHDKENSLLWKSGVSVTEE